MINLKKYYKDLLLIVLFVFILGISFDVYAASCTGVFSNNFLEDMNNYVYIPIKWLTPVALLILTSIDFAGVVIGGKKENMDKAKKNFMKRAVAALIIFFAPDIIKLITNFIQDQSIASCMKDFQ